MRRYPKRGGQFAIIPVELLYEDGVPPTAKLLYGEIYRLSDADGWCDASNKDFMDLLGCSETTVRNLLRALEGVEQIRVVSEPSRDAAGGTKRMIFCGRKLAAGVPAEICGYPEKSQGGTRKNLRGVPAEICGDTLLESNNRSNIPPISPQGERRVRKRKEPRPAPDWKPERFEGLWNFYPAKGRKSKQDAMNAWDALKPDDALIDTIARSLKKLKATEEWQRDVGIPYVATFLRGERWTDADAVDAPEDAPRFRRYIGTEIVDGEERDIYA